MSKNKVKQSGTGTSSQMESKHTKQDLDGIALNMAGYMNSNYFHVHRGASQLSQQLCVVFGNDGYSTDERAKLEAQAVKDWAEGADCLCSDIQIEPNGITWAVAVVGDHDIAEALKAITWDVWLEQSQKRVSGRQS
jgi:hypothetical protein